MATQGTRKIANIDAERDAERDAAFAATLPEWARTHYAVVFYAQDHPDYAEDLRAAEAQGWAWRNHLIDEAYAARASGEEEAREEWGWAITPKGRKALARQVGQA